MQLSYELDVQRFGPDRPVKKITMDRANKLKPVIRVFQISIVGACVYYIFLNLSCGGRSGGATNRMSVSHKAFILFSIGDFV
ncbi:hypothetical protein TSUD_173050 [Trifolium subterraneum]|nr:hypothetical protein TSUD_173050 [Trifolium subterraneum]